MTEININERLKELGIELPKASAAVGSYLPAKRSGKLLYVSGQLPFIDGELLYSGIVGEEVNIDQAREAIVRSAINTLAVVESHGGGVNNIAEVVRLAAYVASTPQFTDQPKVANAASDLFVEIFGESGRHARAAIGAPSLPLNSPVELEVLFELKI